MGAFGSKDANRRKYRLLYFDRKLGTSWGSTIARDHLVRELPVYVKAIADGRIESVKVLNEHGEDVTVDWFG